MDNTIGSFRGQHHNDESSEHSGSSLKLFKWIPWAVHLIMWGRAVPSALRMWIFQTGLINIQLLLQRLPPAAGNFEQMDLKYAELNVCSLWKTHRALQGVFIRRKSSLPQWCERGNRVKSSQRLSIGAAWRNVLGVVWGEKLANTSWNCYFLSTRLAGVIGYLGNDDNDTPVSTSGSTNICNVF